MMYQEGEDDIIFVKSFYHYRLKRRVYAKKGKAIAIRIKKKPPNNAG